ncbi:DUF7249 family protein [Mesorhizobium sp. A623]
MSYNGWKNYETWNVALWVRGERGLYLAMRERRDLNHFKAETAEAFCRELFPKGPPDMGQPSDMDLVDWEEIAAGFNAD